MPVDLTEPKQAVVLDKARVVAINIENNPYLNQYWVDVFVVLGLEVDGQWIQHVDPDDGAIAKYYRIAPGCNPHARPAFQSVDPRGDGVALGKCNTCGVWHPAKTGACTAEGCSGSVLPYDGFQRLVLGQAAGSTNYDVIKNAVYGFLTTEQVPDPVTGEIRPLLAATE